MKYIINFLILLVISTMISGCATHPVSLAPSVNYNELVLGEKYKASAGYYISPIKLEKRIEESTGSDNISYFPYRDLQSILAKTLSASFTKVNKTSLKKDTSVDYNFVPRIQTRVSEKSALFWPPIGFMIDLDVSVYKNGHLLDVIKGHGNSLSKSKEFLSDFNYTPKQAMKMAMLDFQQNLRNSKITNNVNIIRGNAKTKIDNNLEPKDKFTISTTKKKKEIEKNVVKSQSVISKKELKKKPKETINTADELDEWLKQ